MHIDVEDRNGIKVIHVRGDLTGAPESELLDTARGLLEGRGARLVIDMAEVPFINSSGIGDLVRLTAQANAEESRVIVAGDDALTTLSPG
jgi:anti-anti-sigma factor